MRSDIINYLSQITQEEQYIMVENESAIHSLYTDPGRFIIRRKNISSLASGEPTAAISIHPHPRFCEFPSHSHDFIEMMYVCSGSITHVFNKEEVSVNTDSIIFFGKNTKHSIRTASNDDIGVNLIISIDMFKSLLNDMRKNSDLRVTEFENLIGNQGASFYVFDCTENIVIQNLIENIIEHAIIERNSDGYILKQSVSLLLCHIAHAQEKSLSSELNTPSEKLQRKILEYIRSSYSTATLSELANMLGFSTPYVSRMICNSFGLSFKELLMRERFSVACDLLCTTKIPIGDIINHIGYENSSYFHKEFKKRYGMTPKNYRKNN